MYYLWLTKFCLKFFWTVESWWRFHQCCAQENPLLCFLQIELWVIGISLPMIYIVTAYRLLFISCVCVSLVLYDIVVSSSDISISTTVSTCSTATGAATLAAIPCGYAKLARWEIILIHLPTIVVMACVSSYHY